jgi:hypothetical protein
MTASAVSLCNEALRLLGDSAITSFTEGTDLAETCNRLYPTTLNALLAGHPWRFTMAKAQLSQLADPPLTEWRHAFALPPDMLALRHVFPAAEPGAAVLDRYEIEGNRLYADRAPLWADYQRAVEPGNFPPWFTQLARLTLAADFAMAVTNNVSAVELFTMKAQAALREARHLDSQQQPNAVIHASPLAEARLGSRRWR